MTNAQCMFECGQSKAQVVKLRERLGLPGTPASFDEELRERLKQEQKKRGLPPTGQYDVDTARAMTNDTAPALQATLCAFGR